MSASPPEVPESSSVPNSQTIVDPRQQSLGLPLPPALQSLISLEQTRIESFNRRTDVVRYAIETNDAADKRQYEFQMAKLQADNTASRERHRLTQIVMIGGGSVLTLVVGSILAMAFLGSAAQSEMAISILKVLGIGAAGYGIVEGISGIVRRMIQEHLNR